MSSTSVTLPDIAKVPSLSAEERANILDLLFEPCTQLHTLSVPSLSEKNFEDYGELVATVKAQLDKLQASDLESDQKSLHAILSAHPRLGEKKVESAMSKAEQAGLQGQGQEEETEKLRGLNAKYEAKFPGLRYVTFVNGRPRPAITADISRRIETSSLTQEKTDAVAAMCDIAVDRAKKLGAQIRTGPTSGADTMTPGSFQPS